MAGTEYIKPPSGWLAFAAVVMVLAGIFSILDGLVALITDEVYLVTEEGVVAFDFTTWGAIHLVLGILVVIGGFAVLSGQTWARMLGVVLASASAVAQVAFITAFPLWSVVIIAIDILVIYGLVVHGTETGDA